MTDLGHLVDATIVCPIPSKLAHIDGLKALCTLTRFRRVLGINSYFCRFIHQFYETAFPSVFFWANTPPIRLVHRVWRTFSTADAFAKVCNFYPTAPTQLRTVASGFGIGAFLAYILSCITPVPICFPTVSGFFESRIRWTRGFQHEYDVKQRSKELYYRLKRMPGRCIFCSMDLKLPIRLSIWRSDILTLPLLA